jgi:hypothetical protein
VSKMQLRSGKSLVLPSTYPSPLEVVSACFGATWPTVETARKLSISTNSRGEFHSFCYEILHKSDCPRSQRVNKFMNRLYSLALVESFYQCGSQVLQTYLPVMRVMYEKLGAAHEVTPPDMAEYLAKLKSLIEKTAC